MSERKRKHRAQLSTRGLVLGKNVVPLWAGAVHYFRLEVATWRPALEAVKQLGFRLVDIYVPWAVHELEKGSHDFGHLDPRKDLRAFLDLCHELELFVVLRPGPHINAELTGFGIPMRVLWDPECQARSPRSRPVVLPVPPLAFPVPSYASSAFLDETDEWYRVVAEQVEGRIWPDGPIVLVQVDNEGAMYFRDGVYDQDYHPDAIAQYRRFLKKRYSTVKDLCEAYGDPDATFARAEPPRAFSARSANELAPHLDWAEFQEQLLSESFQRMRRSLEAHGISDVPFSHNLPLSEGVTPLDPARLGKVVELVGQDYYHGASAPSRLEIARRTSELRTRADQARTPAFACELGAGFPPFFPPLTPEDQSFTTLCALAYGLNALSAYMAVDRDRWIGAPIDMRGKLRDTSAWWQSLLAAVERVQLRELSRQVAVQIVVPRSLRRLTRVCHAFGPLSAALFQVVGGGAPEACFEDDLGALGPVAIDTERFLRRLESKLEAARIPYGLASAECLKSAARSGGWTIVLCSSALEPKLAAAIANVRKTGACISVGPFAPRFDHRFIPSAEVQLPKERQRVPGLLSLDDDELSHALDVAQQELALPHLAATPEQVFVTVHRDSAGRARLLFVINPTAAAVQATVTAAGAKSATDALSAETFGAKLGALHVPMPPRSVRMLELREKA
ncbi:MAG: beta-galactosidase [Polyangiaceae bacterium]